ncbi:unnamed protein product [Pleuronectes platessa]|uniref:Uncharacterized protein n=1 Tax=Pleuronectes platessa TaxID=8262 RepID=A0A9N7UBU5_PLEPL|nr:unnamed protein product [Pleuronectes platessa]
MFLTRQLLQTQSAELQLPVETAEDLEQKDEEAQGSTVRHTASIKRPAAIKASLHCTWAARQEEARPGGGREGGGRDHMEGFKRGAGEEEEEADEEEERGG